MVPSNLLSTLTFATDFISCIIVASRLAGALPVCGGVECWRRQVTACDIASNRAHSARVPGASRDVCTAQHSTAHSHPQ